jgi:hypothetical protein
MIDSRRSFLSTLGAGFGAIMLRRFSPPAVEAAALDFFVQNQTDNFCIDGPMSSMTEYAIFYDDIDYGDLPPIGMRVDAQGLLIRTEFLSTAARNFILRNWRWRNVPGERWPIRPAEPLNQQETVQRAREIRSTLCTYLGMEPTSNQPAQPSGIVLDVAEQMNRLGILDQDWSSPFGHCAIRLPGWTATWVHNGAFVSLGERTPFREVFEGTLIERGAMQQIREDYDTFHGNCMGGVSASSLIIAANELMLKGHLLHLAGQ